MLAEYNSDYHYFQFYITKEDLDRNPPKGWFFDRFLDWTVFTCPGLPRIKLTNSVDEQIGCILGVVIDARNCLIRDGENLSVPPECDSDEQHFEHWLAKLRGRFVVFVVSNKMQRFYLDPMGSLAAVYSNRTPTVASTWSLLKTPSGDDLKQALNGYPCNAPCKYYPAGLTRTDDVSRLLPNFYLDLRSWNPRRHWPSAEIKMISCEDAKAQTQNIATHISNIVSALAIDSDLYIGATAGQDARLIIGCIPKHLYKSTQLVTFSQVRKGQSAVADLQTGAAVAKTIGIERIVLNIPEKDEDVMEQFLARIGVAAGAAKGMDYYQAARNSLDLRNTWLTGFGGEVLRTFCFKDDATCSREYSEEELLQSIELPAFEKFKKALRQWRSTLPYESGRFLLDQLYYEIRHGCWAMPLQYGTANFRRNLTPFSSRYVIETCYSFPHQVRCNLGIFVLSEVSPELATIPTNRLFGMQLVARRALSNRFYSIPVWLGRR